MYSLPTVIEIGGKEYAIRNQGDYRMVLDCCVALSDEELEDIERIFAALCIFYEDVNEVGDLSIFDDVKEAVTEMYNFLRCGEEESHTHSYKLIDWESDEQLIASAINKVVGKEIRVEPYIHWWTFMGYYMAIGECPLSHIVSIRSKIVKGQKLEKHEKQFKRENPQYFSWDGRSLEQKEAEAWVASVWNSGA